MNTTSSNVAPSFLMFVDFSLDFPLAECYEGYEKQGDSCVECPIGAFKGYYGLEKTCQPCPEGSTNDQVGSTSFSTYL